MLDTRPALALLCALTLALAGCTAQQRAGAGAAVALAGGATTAAGLSIATGYFPDDDEEPSEPNPWRPPPPTAKALDDDDHFEANPGVGLPTVFVGLALTVLGGVIFGVSTPRSLSVAAPGGS